MSLEDEVKRMRRDIEDISDWVNLISQRLDAIERELSEEISRESPIPTDAGIARPPAKPTATTDRIKSYVEARSTAPPPPPPRMQPVVGNVPPSAPTAKPQGSEFVTATPSWGELPIERFFKERIETIRKKTQEFGWEVLLGTYWLPRIAVVCISIAVVFFLSLAIKRWGAQWLPHLRVAIGYAVCAGLLALAWRTEKKHREFARVLYGGGFAVMYFVTFATHYIGFSRIFHSPEITLSLLAVVVVSWGIVAQIRHSKTVAVLVTGLGHLTILLSTLTLERPGPFSMAGLLFLTAGSAFFLLKNSWYYVASLGIVGCYLNAFVVLSKSTGGDPLTDFVGSMSVLSAFLLMFAAAELLAPEELRRKTIPTWFRSLFVTANTAAFFGLGTMLVAHFEFTREHQDLFRFYLATMLMLFGIAYLQLRKSDPLYNAYITKAVVVMTLGLAARYGGSSLMAWLSIEGLVLLLSARRSGLVVTRLLGYAVSAVALAYSLNLAAGDVILYEAPEYKARLVQGIISVLAFLIASQLYERTDWRSRSPKTAPFDNDLLIMCWQLDLIGERPRIENKSFSRPLDGLLFPFLYAVGSAIVFVGHTRVLAAFGHRFAVIGVFAFLLLGAAMALRSKPFSCVSAMLSVAVALVVGTHEFHTSPVLPWAIAIVGLVALALIAFGSEQKYVGSWIGLTYHQIPPAPYVLYAAPAFLTGLLFVNKLGDAHAVIALIIATVATGGLSLVLHTNALSAISVAYLLWAGICAYPHFSEQTNEWRTIAWSLMALSLLVDRYYHLRREQVVFAPALGTIAVVNAWIVFLCYIEANVPIEWRQAAAAAAAFFFLAYGGFLRSPAALAVAVAGALLASVRQSIGVFDFLEFQSGLAIGFALLALFWILIERLVVRFWDALEKKAREAASYVKVSYDDKYAPYIPLVPVALTTALLLLILHRIPHLLPANLSLITMSWFGLAVFLFVVSLPFHQSFYRYAGFVVLLLSLGRVFLIDMKEQDPLLRVAAFAVLGIGLLPISYGYFRWKAALRAKRKDDAAGKPQEAGSK